MSAPDRELVEGELVVDWEPPRWFVLPDEPLRPLHLEILAFARETWKSPGRQESAIRDRFGIPMTKFFFRLNMLLDHPGAVAYDPLAVNRLRDLREARRRARTGKDRT